MSNGAELSREKSFMSLRDSIAAHPSQEEPPEKRFRGRRSILFLVFLLIIGTSSITFGQAVANPDSTLEAIKTLFDNGSYITAELQARRILEDKTVSDSMRVQLEKYVGFALVAQGKNESAVAHFVIALRLDSSLTLDPVLTSPKILAVFESARVEYLAERTKETAGTSRARSVMERGPTFRVVLFPGWDQIYNGKSTKGYILLTAGAATALTAIGSDLLRRQAHTRYLAATTPAMAESRYATYNAYYHAEVYSVSAFILLYAYSELDSFLDLPPHFAADYSSQYRSVSLSFRIGF